MKGKRGVATGLLLSLILAFGVLPAAVAQERGNTADQEEGTQSERAKRNVERLERLRKGEVELGKDGNKRAVSQPDAGLDDPMMPEAPSAFLSDPSTQAKYLAALQEYYGYRIAGLQHRRAVFKWQLFSAKVLFVVVQVLVCAGIYFAAVQFHRGLGRKSGPRTGEGEERTEFVASVKGIKVSSPVLGVVILVISLAFFYLYLVYVYPIEDIF